MSILDATVIYELIFLQKFQKRFFVLDKTSLRYYQTPYVSNLSISHPNS